MINRPLLFTLLAVLFLSTLSLTARADDLPLDSYTSEPTVRIGVLLKAQSAAIKLDGAYTVLNKETEELLAQGRNGAFTVTLLPTPAEGVPGNLYRVTVGSFKSYEDASFHYSQLLRMDKHMRIAYPEGWFIWFGPYSSTHEARAILEGVKAAGYANSRIEPVPLGKAGYTVAGSSGAIIYSGSSPLVLRASSGLVAVDKATYRGNAEILPDSVGAFTVVNVVKAEDYLRSVVPAEMPSGSHPEALKAQAIIARTYLLNNRHRHEVDGFELCGTTDCQVYSGIGHEFDSTNQAIRDTRGMVVAYNGRLANALFHSTCGGRTSHYTDIWTGASLPYLVSVNDGTKSSTRSLATESGFLGFLDDGNGYCKKSKYYHWDRTNTLKEMQAIIDENIPKYLNKPGIKPGALRDIRILERSDSGRVLRIAIDTDLGSYEFERDTIRWVLGNTRSTMFTVSKKTDAKGQATFVFRGAGWGHGVGLCQMGAMAMARDGKSTRDIISHYYTGATVTKLWE
jgi:SpoIID/LytB domain protein